VKCLRTEKRIVDEIVEWYVGEMVVDKVSRYACHCFLGIN
jgi:hypothetical protein